jgi:hypothetical protein
VEGFNEALIILTDLFLILSLLKNEDTSKWIWYNDRFYLCERFHKEGCSCTTPSWLSMDERRYTLIAFTGPGFCLSFGNFI